MPVTECPKCNQELGPEALVCPTCGWPHAEESAAEETTPPPTPLVVTGGLSPTSCLLLGLGIGLVVGLLLGWIGGRISAPAAPPSAAAPVVEPARGPGREPAARGAGQPQPLRLREQGWHQSSPGLCKGVFEVVSAPPSVAALRFSAMDAAGKLIGTDQISTDGTIKPGTQLELGFEVGECARIQKWQVQIVDK